MPPQARSLTDRKQRSGAFMESRRHVLAKLGALTALLTLGFRSQAFAGTAGRSLPAWVQRIDSLSAMLRGQTVTVQEWRGGLEELSTNIPLQEVLRDIDFDRLHQAAGFAEWGVATANIDFGDDNPRRLRFFPKFFAIDRGRAIIPHGHANMVSAHLVLGGRLHVRQYDQLERNAGSLLVRPRFEGSIGPGTVSSIGHRTDNVHWFVAEEPSHTFDAIVGGLDERQTHPYEIFNLDMDRAQPEGDALRVPRLGFREALKKYG